MNETRLHDGNSSSRGSRRRSDNGSGSRSPTRDS